MDRSRATTTQPRMCTSSRRSCLRSSSVLSGNARSLQRSDGVASGGCSNQARSASCSVVSKMVKKSSPSVVNCARSTAGPMNVTRFLASRTNTKSVACPSSARKRRNCDSACALRVCVYVSSDR